MELVGRVALTRTWLQKGEPKMLWSCKTKISFLCLASLLSAARGELAGPRLVAQAQESYVMGFPVLIVLEAWGPERVPRADILCRSAEVEIALSEKGGERRYVLRFAPPPTGTVTTADGYEVEPSTVWSEDVDGGMCRRMLLDLCSIDHFFDQGLTLDDVPEGTYNCEVMFPASLSHVKSNAFTVTFVTPTRDEQDALRELKNRPAGRKNRDVVSWVEFLIRRQKVPVEYLGKLRKETVMQLGLHLLISGVNTSRKKIEDIDMKELDGTIVPPYLAPEKECFLIEVMLVSGRKAIVEERKEKLSRECPGLKWRFDKLASGAWDLLSPRRGL